MTYQVVGRNKVTGKEEVLQMFGDHQEVRKFAMKSTVNGTYAWVEKIGE